MAGFVFRLKVFLVGGDPIVETDPKSNYFLTHSMRRRSTSSIDRFCGIHITSAFFIWILFDFVTKLVVIFRSYAIENSMSNDLEKQQNCSRLNIFNQPSVVDYFKLFNQIGSAYNNQLAEGNIDAVQSALTSYLVILVGTIYFTVFHGFMAFLFAPSTLETIYSWYIFRNHFRTLLYPVICGFLFPIITTVFTVEEIVYTALLVNLNSTQLSVSQQRYAESWGLKPILAYAIPVTLWSWLYIFGGFIAWRSRRYILDRDRRQKIKIDHSDTIIDALNTY